MDSVALKLNCELLTRPQKELLIALGEGFSYPEIRICLKLTHGAYFSRLYRIRKNLGGHVSMIRLRVLGQELSNLCQ